MIADEKITQALKNLAPKFKKVIMGDIVLSNKLIELQIVLSKVL